MRNTELLNATLARIEAQPDLWDQQHWARHTDCGTAYCFAGTALMLAGKAEFVWASRYGDGLEFAEQMADPGDIGTTNIGAAAQLLLGLDEDEAAELFDPENTFEQLCDLVGQLTAEPDGGALDDGNDRA